MDPKSSNSLLKSQKIEPKEAVTVTAVAAEPSIKPREVITYSKGTQTQVEEVHSESEDEQEKEARLIARLTKDIESQLRMKELENEQLRKSREVAVAVQVPDTPDRITEDQEKPREDSTARATPEIIDYTQDPEVEPENTEGRVKEMVQFNGGVANDRMITSIDWSTKYNELLLASYSKNSLYSNEVQGVVLVWNCKKPQRPEFSLYCQGQVQKAIFSPHHANYIIGGTYSGQIMLWDTRAKSEPVLTTPLTGKGHTYPITGLDIIGTRQAHNIVSTSSDGTVCSWAIDMLAQPQESMQLVLQPPSRVEEVAPTAVSHSPADTSTFLVGTEEGSIYSVNRQDRAGAKAGIDTRVLYKGHKSTVTGIEHHPRKGPIDLGDLLLTSSLDWSVRLWRLKSSNAFGSITSGNDPVIVSPLLEVQKDDMVYDVRWSPQRPGVFATVDCTGECHIHDICQSHEVPVAKAIPSVPRNLPVSQMRRALNKVAWDRDEGKRLAVGGVNGILTVFEVPESLGGKEGTSNDQWSTLNSRLKRC